MKTQIVLVLAALCIAVPGFAKDEASCKVVTNDIGTIIGHGATADAAFEDAATKCFDRHSALYQAKHSRDVVEDTGLLYIDVCANVHCS